MNQSETLERRILWFDEEDPVPPPIPATPVDGLIPTPIGIWGVLQARPGPGDAMRSAGARVAIPFTPAGPTLPAVIVPGVFAGLAPTLEALIPIGIGIWGTLRARPQPGDDLR